MSIRKFSNIDWGVPETEKGDIASWEGVKLSLLMDIRDELKKINRVLGCTNCLDIPFKLDRIEKNTKRKTYRKSK